MVQRAFMSGLFRALAAPGATKPGVICGDCEQGEAVPAPSATAAIRKYDRPGGSIINCTFGVDPETIWGMSNSLASLGLVLARGFEGLEPFAVHLTMLLEAADIFIFEDRVGPADVAEIVLAFRVSPSHGYLDLCTAIVRDGHADAGTADHGWPILVLRGGVDNPTIAEGGAVQNPVLNICDRVPGGREA